MIINFFFENNLIYFLYFLSLFNFVFESLKFLFVMFYLGMLLFVFYIIFFLGEFSFWILYMVFFNSWNVNGI